MSQFDQVQVDLRDLQGQYDDLKRKYDKIMKDFDEHQHTGTDNSRPIISDSLSAGNSSTTTSSDFVTGTVKTTNEVPAIIDIVTVQGSKPVIILLYVIASDADNQEFGAFARNVVFKKTVGITSYFDQIQDLFTMKENDFNVDFSHLDDKAQVRLWGLASKNITWTYFYKVFTSN